MHDKSLNNQFWRCTFVLWAQFSLLQLTSSIPYQLPAQGMLTFCSELERYVGRKMLIAYCDQKSATESDGRWVGGGMNGWMAPKKYFRCRKNRLVFIKSITKTHRKNICLFLLVFLFLLLVCCGSFINPQGLAIQWRWVGGPTWRFCTTNNWAKRKKGTHTNVRS